MRSEGCNSRRQLVEIDMREIRADERPLTVAAEQLRDGAGRKLLDGNRKEAAAGLRRYLSELRRLGRPQSSSHGINTEIEVAARQEPASA
jgi:hypothetical protein